MKALFFLMYSIYSFGSQTPVINPLEASKCEKSVSSFFRENLSLNDWRRVSDLDTNIKVYRSPTKKIGQWIEYNTDNNNTTHIVSSDGIRKVDFDPKTCLQKNSTAPQKDAIFLTSTGSRFSDADLSKILRAKKNALIYVYSPKMTYSAKNIDTFVSIAKKLKLQFVPLVSSTVSASEFEHDLGKKFPFKYKRLNSVELTMREMQVHFPTSLVVYNGKIIEPTIVGVMQSKDLEFEINQRITLSAGANL